MIKSKQHFLNIMQHAQFCLLPTGKDGAIIQEPILFDTVKDATHWLQAQEHKHFYVICDNLGNPL